MERPNCGLSALFTSRREADVAVEHLVQEHGIDRAVIFVEPAGEASTTGTHVAGADAPSGDPASEERTDAPLKGEIRLKVFATNNDRSTVDRALREAGAHQIRRMS